MSTNKQIEQIKNTIVKTCKRGVCNHNGGDIPMEKRGRCGKGSHYIAMSWMTSEAYRENFDRVFGSKK